MSSAERVAQRFLARWTPLPQDQFGVKTLVRPKSQLNLPTRNRDPDDPQTQPDDPDASQLPDGAHGQIHGESGTVTNNDPNTNTSLDAGRWPVKMSPNREKQRALPLPSGHPIQRDRSLFRPVYNVPDGQPGSRERTKTITPVRTPGVPGEQYGTPTKYDYNTVTRRTMTAEAFILEAGLTRIFPEKRQKNQTALAKRYYNLRYKRTKGQVKRRQRLRYIKLNRRPAWGRDRRFRKLYPKRYKRIGIGFRSPAERTKQWREDNPGKAKKQQTKKRKTKREEKRPRQPRQPRQPRTPKKAMETGFEMAFPIFWEDGTFLEITNLNPEQGTVEVTPEGGEPEWLSMRDVLYRAIPVTEEDGDDLINLMTWAFGLEPFVSWEWEDDGTEAEHGERAAVYETFHRDQTGPTRLDQNINQPNKGTPRQDKTKNKYDTSAPAPGNDKGKERPTSWVGPMTGDPGITTPNKYPKHRGQPFSNPDIDRAFKQPAVEQQSGSAKVIPDVNRSTGDLSWRNKNGPIPDRGFKVAQRYLQANTMRSILRFVDPEIKARAKDYSPQFVGLEPKRLVFKFETKGSSGQTWKQFVRVLPRPGSKKTTVDGMDVRVKCTCPFHRWQGPEHWGVANDYQYGGLKGTATFPIIRDPKHEQAICKHLVAVFDYMRSNRMKIPAEARLLKRGRYSSDREPNYESPAADRVAARYLSDGNQDADLRL